MNETVRRAIENASNSAKRNLEYLDKELAKAEREQLRLIAHIGELEEERIRNAEALAAAEVMLK